jgi:DNA excision repair protein ERCC-2
MSLRLDENSRTLSLSVGDLCDEIAGGGSLNATPFQATRLDMGREVHVLHQSESRLQQPGYVTEYPIRFVTAVRGYTIIIQGRLDGLYQEDGAWTIEEVKSVLDWQNPFTLSTVPFHYILQLQMYLFLCLQNPDARHVIGRLVLISCDLSRKHILEVAAEPDKTWELMRAALERFLDRHEQEQVDHARKRTWATRLTFPFPAIRQYQDQMIVAIQKALETQGRLLVSAPTGIGKTVAALYATLRYALQEGLTVFFLTSKTTQQRTVADTLRLWLGEPSAGEASSAWTPPFRSLILQSKEKSCANDVVFCHESRCLYARDFYTKLEEADLSALFHRVGLITPEIVYEKAVGQEVCPFELALELLSQVDLVVCDYNYVYDPRVALKRVFEDDYSRIILVIDEAHNLYSRGRGYYSAELRLSRIECLKRGTVRLLENQSGREPFPLAEEHQDSFANLESVSSSFLDRLASFLARLEEYFAELEISHPAEGKGQRLVEFDREFFESLTEDLEELLRCYMMHQRRPEIPLSDEAGLLDFLYEVSNFCSILKLEGGEFAHVLDRNAGDALLQIICLDPSRQLGKRNQGFHCVIGMSATLTPLLFYRDVLGFERDTELLRLPSPFPAANRKVLILPEVSTSYRDRSRNASRIARIIEEVIALRRGNYLAFFPSFEFQTEVALHLSPRNYRLLLQERSMPDHARNSLLEKLLHQRETNLLLAVQGGIFAEGVDYPGELAVGAFIVGPALPRVSFEQELMRQYYEEMRSKGFDYAYLFPGMNRVIQSAGRVIRSEEDRGIILLLDKRFTYENYAGLLPREWYIDSPSELVRKQYLEELKCFWLESSA